MLLDSPIRGAELVFVILPITSANSNIRLIVWNVEKGVVVLDKLIQLSLFIFYRYIISQIAAKGWEGTDLLSISKPARNREYLLHIGVTMVVII